MRIISLIDPSSMVVREREKTSLGASKAPRGRGKARRLARP